MLAVTSCSENAACHSPCGSIQERGVRRDGSVRSRPQGEYSNGHRGQRHSPQPRRRFVSYERNPEERFRESPSSTGLKRIRSPCAAARRGLLVIGANESSYSTSSTKTRPAARRAPPSPRNTYRPPSPRHQSPTRKTRPRSTFSYPEPIVTAPPPLRGIISKNEEESSGPTTPKKMAATPAISSDTPTTCKEMDFDYSSDDDSTSADDASCASTKSGSLVLLQFDPCKRDHLSRVRQISGTQYQFKTSDGRLGTGRISEMDRRKEEGKNARDKNTVQKKLVWAASSAPTAILSIPSHPHFPKIPTSPRQACLMNPTLPEVHSQPSMRQQQQQQQPVTACPGSPASCTKLRSHPHPHSPAGLIVESSMNSAEDDASSRSGSFRGRNSLSQLFGGAGSRSATSNEDGGKLKYRHILRTQSGRFVDFPPFSPNEIAVDRGSQGKFARTNQHSKQTLEAPTSSPHTALPAVSSKRTPPNAAGVLPRAPYAPPSPLVPTLPICSGPASHIVAEGYGDSSLSAKGPSSSVKCRIPRTDSIDVLLEPVAEREISVSGEALPKQQPLPVLNRSSRRTKMGDPPNIPSSISTPSFSSTAAARSGGDALWGGALSPTKPDRKGGGGGRGSNDHPLPRARSLRWLPTYQNNRMGEERVVSSPRTRSGRHCRLSLSTPLGMIPSREEEHNRKRQDQREIAAPPATTTGILRDGSASTTEAAVGSGEDSNGTGKKSSRPWRVPSNGFAQSIGRYFRNSTKRLKQPWQYHQQQQQVEGGSGSSRAPSNGADPRTEAGTVVSCSQNSCAVMTV